MIDGQPYSFYKYEQIRKEQLFLAQATKGAIPITATDDMPIHDRKLLVDTIRQQLEERKRKIEEDKQNRKFRKPHR